METEQAILLLQAGASLDPLRSLLERLGLDARPLHPGSRDPTLQGWYGLIQRRRDRHRDPQADAQALDAALAQLQQAPGVDGAYRKPPGEAPG